MLHVPIVKFVDIRSIKDLKYSCLKVVWSIGTIISDSKELAKTIS